MRCEPISQGSALGRGPSLSVKAWQTETAREDIFYNFPDGALVVMFVKTWWDGEQRDIGGFQGRENIRFVGWLDGETVRFGPNWGEVEFEAIGSDGVMRRIPSFGFSVEKVAVPTGWYEQKDCNVDRALHFLLQYHSTVNEVCHVNAPNEGGDRPIAIQHFPDVSLYDQAQESLLKDAQCMLTADRQGVLKATIDPQFMTDVNRDLVPVVCSLGDAQWADQVEESALHTPQVGKIRLGGFQLETPLLSQAPGVAPLQQEAETIVEGRLLASQAEANRWSGQALAKANNPYPTVPLTLRGHWPIFDPADQEWIRLTVTDPLGRNVWEDKRFVVREVRFRDLPKLGTSVTELVLEMETDWMVGETDTIPQAPDPEPPSWRPHPVPLPPPNPPIAEEWPVKLYVGTVRLGVYYTENFGGPTDPMPTWAAVNTGLSDTTCKQLAVDYFDPEGRQYCLLTTAVGNELYRREACGSWTLILNLAAAEALTGDLGGSLCSMCTNDGTAGYVHVVYVDGSGPYYRRAYHLYSGDHGASWNFNQVTAGFVYRGGTIRARGQTVYVGVNRDMGGKGYFYRSPNLGVAWFRSVSLGSSVWTPCVHASPVDFTLKYARQRGDYDLARVNIDDTITILQPALDLDPGVDAMWLSRRISGFQRVSKDSRLYVTQDGWATVDDATPGLVVPPVGTIIAPTPGDEDFIIWGAGTLTALTPHVILNMEGETTLVAVGRAGPNPATPPYTNSIPYKDPSDNANGPCWNGIQPVSWE
jgi:hypothetical protein